MLIAYTHGELCDVKHRGLNSVDVQAGMYPYAPFAV